MVTSPYGDSWILSASLNYIMIYRGILGLAIVILFLKSRLLTAKNSIIKQKGNLYFRITQPAKGD